MTSDDTLVILAEMLASMPKEKTFKNSNYSGNITIYKLNGVETTKTKAKGLKTLLKRKYPDDDIKIVIKKKKDYKVYGVYREKF